VLSLFFKGAMAMLLGAPPEAMLIFEIYLSVGSLTEHANVRLPQGLDRAIRPIWVTPAMHIIHHSAEARDRDHNFSFALSLWDRLFGTYLGAASGPRIGLSN
jgi:sterol desaturase/sphingolipid hydroxylase (fatty acid hydroxylase superfamily)